MAGRHRSLWLRWSWRDFKRHWTSVLAIAAVIAIGTGTYAGLGSTSAWRRISNDASFSDLNMHDLRVELSPGTFATAGSLAAIAAGIEHAGWIADADERLIVDTQVDASTVDQTVLVAARVVGAEYGTPGVVDDVWLSAGQMPTAGDGAPRALLEQKFADYYGLPEQGSVTLAGAIPVAYDGLGIGPEQFYVMGPEGSVLAEADLATLYVTLATAQSLLERPGAVNDLVLRLAPGADRDVVEAELDAAVMDPDSQVSATVTTQDEDPAHRILYEDIDNDQQFWDALSVLVLGAAALAAFNLISRIVEAQRREIGIGMALGARRRHLAIRPALLGLQVGLLGTLAGIGVGVLLGSLMQDLLREMIPMPQWLMPFQTGLFVRGAVFGVVPPLLAAALPVWRAVRVEPIDAIRTGHLAATRGRLGGWARRVRVPGSSIAQMPVRNLLRAPRRTLLTAAGVGAAITALVTVLGMLDSFGTAIDRGSNEVTRGNRERVTVTLDTYYPADAAVVRAVAAIPEAASVDASVKIPATVATAGHDEIELSLELLDLQGAAWTPSVLEAVPEGPQGGIVLAQKAARDLGVDIGGTVQLTHPALTPTGFTMTTSDATVSAIHPNPIRNIAFMDSAQSMSLGLPGVVNTLQVVPAGGFERSDVQRRVFTIPGVASAQPVARVGEVFDEAMQQFVGFLVITAGAVLVLALLIAFNSARISVDERRREHATMMAFGLRPRTVVSTLVREAGVIGLLATAIGVAGGIAVLQWLLTSLAARTLPDFDIPLIVSPMTLLTALLVGVASVALAPLFLVRRVRRMNLPETLRVME